MAGEPFWMKELRRLPGGARVIAKYKRPENPDAGERLMDFIHVTGDEYFRLDVPKPRCYVKCIGPVAERHDFVVARCVSCRVSIADAGPTFAGHDECCPVAWWYCDPLGHWGRLDGSDVTEQADGSITTGLIDNHGTYDVWWRGTITNGVWAGDILRVEKSLDVE